MRLPDRVTGLFLVGLGAAAAYGGWQLPPVPGQPVGPNVFPLVIGSGLAGLTAANYLGKCGRSVLLLEQHYNFGGMATWFRRKGGQPNCSSTCG